LCKPYSLSSKVNGISKGTDLGKIAHFIANNFGAEAVRKYEKPPETSLATLGHVALAEAAITWTRLLIITDMNRTSWSCFLSALVARDNKKAHNPFLTVETTCEA